MLQAFLLSVQTYIAVQVLSTSYIDYLENKPACHPMLLCHPKQDIIDAKIKYVCQLHTSNVSVYPPCISITQDFFTIADVNQYKSSSSLYTAAVINGLLLLMHDHVSSMLKCYRLRWRKRASRRNKR